MEINAAGSTFIAPLMNTWASEFAKTSDMQVYYLAVGSGDGVARLLAHGVTFATTDLPALG